MLLCEASGNVPSAKLMGLDEAVFYFGFLPPKTRKILCMKKAIFPGKDETLADYYVRVHGHLLQDLSHTVVKPSIEDRSFLT